MTNEKIIIQKYQQNLRNCQNIHFVSDFYIFKTEIFILKLLKKYVSRSKVIKCNLGK